MSDQPLNKSRYKPWLSLIVGGVCLAVSVVVLLTVKPVVNPEQDNNEDVVYPSFQAEQVAAVSNLGVLIDQVKPLQQTTRVVISSVHEPEFRGTNFVQDNRNRYAVQLFKIGKEDIIKDFLQQRSDRKNFIYLRLTTTAEPDKYVLIYGIYDGEQEAQAVLKRLNLNLPKTIQPTVEKVDSYKPYVRDMGSDEGVQTAKLYDVRLTNAPLPRVTLPVVEPLKTDSNLSDDEDTNTPVVQEKQDNRTEDGDKKRTNAASDTTTLVSPD